MKNLFFKICCYLKASKWDLKWFVLEKIKFLFDTKKLKGYIK